MTSVSGVFGALLPIWHGARVRMGFVSVRPVLEERCRRWESLQPAKHRGNQAKAALQAPQKLLPCSVALGFASAPAPCSVSCSAREAGSFLSPLSQPSPVAAATPAVASTDLLPPSPVLPWFVRRSLIPSFLS